MFTVLGASGYVGSALLRHLGALGEDVYAPARGDPALFTRPLGHVIYCVGLTADYAQRPLDTAEAHAGFLRDVLADANFEKLLYLSSTRLYDSRPAGDIGTPCREDDDLVLNPHNPRHIYDLSKATGESMCLQASRGRGQAVRLSCVYGGDLGQENFLHATIRRAVASRRLEIDTAPEMERDYVHIGDVVRLLPEIARHGRHGIYNLASGVNVGNHELVGAIATAAGCTIRMTGQGGAPAPIVSVARLRDEFGYRPIGVLDSIPELVAAAHASVERAAS